MRWFLVLAAVGKLAAQGCGIIPTPQYYDGTHGSSPIPAIGGTFTISVDTGGATNCIWSAEANNSCSSCVSITLNQTSGTGSGSFTWTAARNVTNTELSGYIYVSGNYAPGVVQGGYTIPVVQLANTCILTLSATKASAAVGTSSGYFSVQTTCEWSAFSNNPSWIAVPSQTNGTGGGAVNYTVAANGCVAARNGTITVEAGSLYSSPNNNSATFTINQDGSPDNLTLSSASATASASGGKGSVNVITGSGCGWNANTDVSWIQIVNGVSGSGESPISYTVAANTGVARTGHISVGTQVFTISQQAAASPVPQLTAVANAASYASGPIAPGEVVALGGTGLGPTTGIGVQLAAGGQSITTTLGGVQVLFDGQYAAALTYVSATQINAIAPYEIAGETSTQIQVQYQGGNSTALQAQVQPAAPGIFTLDYNGIGQGAIRNQDYSVNGNSYPAPRGSTVMIYCTGAGPTDPPSTDAAITTGLSTLAIQPVTVTIGGISAQVPYAGGAPGAVAGLTQVNAVVPANAPTGANVSVVIRIGTWQSQAGVTMVVQ
jgi:uncharacterized protein (TIGR03437 family)